jgi:predicted ATPase
MIGGVLRRVSSPRFVGRADELAALEAALARTPAFCFVAGESGVGKSRLVGELESRAGAAGARVLVGRCLELGDTVYPYAPLVDALRPVVHEIDPPPAHRAALAELLPELGEPAAAASGNSSFAVRSPAAPAGEPRAASPAGDLPATLLAKGRLLEALLALLEELGREQPLLLVIEDLHWADPSTRDFLVYLVCSARSERLCVVATYRSDELHRRHPLQPVLAELERASGAERIALDRFDRDEVADQLAGILDEPPDPSLADRLYERGGGNALYTEELLAASGAGVHELPDTLRDVLLARVERLPEAAQDVVRIAAVVERPVRHGMLEAVSRRSPEEVLEGAREAVAHQVLLTTAGETYAFRHALVGEAVHDDLLPGERTALHAAVGEAIERDPELLGDVSPARVAADLACHWRGALDLPRALGAAVQAGLAARRVYAHSEALRHFESALETWERVPDAAERAGMTRSELLRAAAGMAVDGFHAGRAVALQREAIAAGADHAILYAELADYLREANDQQAAVAHRLGMTGEPE